LRRQLFESGTWEKAETLKIEIGVHLRHLRLNPFDTSPLIPLPARGGEEIRVYPRPSVVK
jgi:hypothetical protein